MIPKRPARKQTVGVVCTKAQLYKLPTQVDDWAASTHNTLIMCNGYYIVEFIEKDIQKLNEEI